MLNDCINREQLRERSERYRLIRLHNKQLAWLHNFYRVRQPAPRKDIVGLVFKHRTRSRTEHAGKHLVKDLESALPGILEFVSELFAQYALILTSFEDTRPFYPNVNQTAGKNGQIRSDLTFHLGAR